MIIKEGWPFVVGFSILGMISLSATPWINQWGIGLAIVFFVAGSFCLFFFRNPERLIRQNDAVILSPGDGKVIRITPAYHSPDASGTMVQIFLSIFDVHIQRFPVSGVVEKIIYQKGLFLPAMNTDAAEKNEKNTVSIKHPKGDIHVTQIAGIIARRIICWLRHGDALKQGDRYGLIFFGSQVDILVPSSVRIAIKVGDRVRAGESIIGEWQ